MLLAPDLWEGTLRSLHAAHAEGVVRLKVLAQECDDVRAKREEAVAHAMRVEALLSEKHAAHEEVAERVAAIEGECLFYVPLAFRASPAHKLTRSPVRTYL